MNSVSPARHSEFDVRHHEGRSSAASSDTLQTSVSVDVLLQNTSASIDELLEAFQEPSPSSLPSATSASTERRVRPEFRRHLRQAVSDSQTLPQLLRNVSLVLSSEAAMDCVAWYSSAGTCIGQRPELEVLSGHDSGVELEASLRDCAARSLTSDERLDLQIRDSHQVVFAVSVSALPGHCLVASTRTHCGVADPSQTAAVELAAACISEWQMSHAHQQAATDVQHVAALVELLGRISGCRTSSASARYLVDQLQDYLGASDLALGFCSGGSPKCRPVAVASRPDIDTFSEFARMTEAVLQESIARNSIGVWPAVEDSQRHALLSHQHYARQLRAEAVVSTPLRNAQGQFVGALVATFADSAAAQEAQRFLFAAERHLGTALDFMHLRQQTVWEKCRTTFSACYHNWKFRGSLLMAGLFAGLMFIPVDYRVSCETELQPVSKRFVAAPFAAPLEECLAEPGDIVEADQLLAVLDGRELRWELAGLRADLARANKEHNAFLSEQKFGEAAIARHEIERLQNQSSLLSERTRNLEIRSPIAGVLVSGDLKGSEGVPLETGQSLFEVAPLDFMLMEVAVPEDDVRHVTPGMEIRLRLDAARSEILTGKIEKLLPAATLREHQNVFVAEAIVPNSSRQLRPGMKGTARVSTGAKPLGWILFHKPLAEVVGWLGW